MSKPITSRVKRSPLLKYSPAKQTADVGGFTPGKDEVIEENVMGEKTDFVSPENQREKDPEKWDKQRKGICQGTIKGDKSKVDCSDIVVDKKKTTVKGKDQEWEGTLKTETKGDVLQPWETRRMSRAIKKEQRDIRRAKKKLARAQKRGNTIKAEEAQAELEEFQAMAGRGKTARASGKRTGTSNVHTGQRDMTQSELGTPEQKEMLERKARAKARKEEAEQDRNRAAKESGVVTGQAVKAINAPAPATPPAPAVGSSAGEDDLYTSSKGYSAFKMKAKSPVAKKLQGNQNKLPQHLQDAIKSAPESPAKLLPLAGILGKALISSAVSKAASPNKKRSGFKMKGYGKKH